jgi:hypothetical protein
MEVQPLTISDQSGAILESTKELAFALMKANYVERDAWEMPDGKIRGLAPEARDISVALRDSVWARFDSLRFHHGLLESVRKQHDEKVVAMTPGEDRARITWTASWHAHYLFDDVVFNASSLFDYLGNTIWFGFHGQNYTKKKWKSTYQAARRKEIEENLPGGVRIFGSATGRQVLDAHAELVNDLYEYRSQLIHNRLEGPKVFSLEFWERNSRGNLKLPFPNLFARQLKKVIPEATDSAQDIDISVGTEHLIKRIGELTLALIDTLKLDLNWDRDEPLMILG